MAVMRRGRWEIWEHEHIPCEDGLQYLVRLRIVRTPWFGVYLHDIHREDNDRNPHTHPWTFWSIILRGWYTERVHPRPDTEPDFSIERTWRRGSIHRMGLRGAHQITDVSPGLRSLIITGPRRQAWGFYVDGELIEWRHYKRMHREST